MIELALQVATGLIFLIALAFAWESTKLAEEKKKRKRDRKSVLNNMTYRELLFKMAKVGMLTLSNDKDGRGLFWAGMNNLEELNKEFDLKDFEVDFPPDKEFYIDKQGRKQEKHNGYEYSQPMFAEKNPKNERKEAK